MAKATTSGERLRISISVRVLFSVRERRLRKASAALMDLKGGFVSFHRLKNGSALCVWMLQERELTIILIFVALLVIGGSPHSRVRQAR